MEGYSIIDLVEKRKVFIVIERRADYSRYRPILQKMKADSFFDIYLVVTGICLLDIHGKDVNYIKEDGFEINAQLKMFKIDRPDTGGEMVRSMARVMSSLVDELEKEYEIQFTMDEVLSVKNVSDIKKHLKNHGIDPEE